MKKPSFSTLGIKEVQLSLYSLSDEDLALEVYQLRIDLKKWITGKFSLDYAEKEKLEQLSPSFVEYAAIKLSNFLAQRKPLQFTVVDFEPIPQRELKPLSS